jgi:DNA processing protein
VSDGANTGAARACAECLDRSRLLARIGARLEIRSRLRGRLFELLALGDAELLDAVGVHSSETTERAPRAGAPTRRDVPPRVDVPPPASEAICRHDPGYPPALGDEGGPRLLYVRGGADRLRALSSGSVVAVCGSSRSTDYGIEVARSIASELAAHGVTIASGLADAVGESAQRAAATVRAGAIAVLGGGHDAGCPATRRALARRIRADGCVVAELPDEFDGRVWGRIAAARVLARLAGVTLVVEADETPVDMSVAQVALALGRTVAVVPGRVTSSASRGAHALVVGGARLVTCASDILPLLGHDRESALEPQACAGDALDPRLSAVLELVGAGSDTPEKLEGRVGRPAEVLLALSRLEVLGLLARGDGGRYVVRGAPRSVRARAIAGGRAHPLA